MINFYKENEIGKAAFADGSIYTPQGNVSLLLDATTKQIIIAEDEKVLFYVNLSETLQVDGEEITGTDAEKLALIAPIFQNAGGGNAGGGTGGRFGYPGEDETSDEDRDMNLGVSSMSVYSGDLDGKNGALNIGNGSASISAQNDDAQHYSSVNAGASRLENFAYFGDVTSRIIQDENGVKIIQNIDHPSFNPALMRRNTFIFPNTAQPNGEEVTHIVASIPTQQFANNADAVAALGVGKLYQSATLLDGSPIILITIPE